MKSEADVRGRREVNDVYKVGREPEGGQNDTVGRDWPAEMTVTGRRLRRKRVLEENDAKEERERKKLKNERWLRRKTRREKENTKNTETELPLNIECTQYI